MQHVVVNFQDPALIASRLLDVSVTFKLLFFLKKRDALCELHEPLHACVEEEAPGDSGGGDLAPPPATPLPPPPPCRRWRGWPGTRAGPRDGGGGASSIFSTFPGAAERRGAAHRPWRRRRSGGADPAPPWPDPVLPWPDLRRLVVGRPGAAAATSAGKWRRATRGGVRSGSGGRASAAWHVGTRRRSCSGGAAMAVIPGCCAGHVPRGSSCSGRKPSPASCLASDEQQASKHGSMPSATGSGDFRP
jgi:hypothetical protein